MENSDKVLQMVMAEVDRQDTRFGADRNQSQLLWNAILTEEVGEYAQAVLDSMTGGKNAGRELEEIIQVAAVAMQIANSFAGQPGPSRPESEAAHVIRFPMGVPIAPEALGELAAWNISIIAIRPIYDGAVELQCDGPLQSLKALVSAWFGERNMEWIFKS